MTNQERALNLVGWQLEKSAAINLAEVVTDGYFVRAGTEASTTWMFAKKTEASCAASAASKD